MSALPVEERWASWRGWAARAMVLGVVLLRYGPLLTLDATFPGHDWLQVHQADAEEAQLALHEGSVLPLWSPYVLAGTPLYAVATKPFSYPPFLLAVPLLGAVGAMDILGLLHVLIGAAGMLALVRRLGGGPAPAAAASILFIAATWPGALFHSQPFWAYALAWWPWTLRAAFDVLDADEPRAVRVAGLQLGVLLALQVLAGGVFQVHWLFCFTAAFALPFLLRRARTVGPGRRALALLVASSVCVGLGAVRVVPALEWMKTSGRSEPLTRDEIFYGYDELATADQPALAVLSATLLEGDRLGVRALGAGCLLGLLFAPRRRLALASLLGLLVCLVIASGAAHDLLVRVLPGYDRMRMPYRFLAPAALGAILLTALGLEGLLRRLPRAAEGPLLIAGLLLLLADVRLLPGVVWQPLMPAPMSAMQAAADPVLDLLDDGSRRRFQCPVAKDQPLWIARGLRSTVGALGGGGSESPAFTEWLPQRISTLELEALHRGVLDVLATRWTLAYEKLDVPWLRLVYEPRPVCEPTDAWAARLQPDGRALDWAGYVGGDGVEEGYGIAAGADGAAWLVGGSSTTDGSFGAAGHGAGSTDAFAAAVGADGDGPSVVFRLGGPGSDAARDVAVAPDGHAWFAGSTTAGDGTAAPGHASPDAFVAPLPDDGRFALAPPAFVGPLPGAMPFVLQGAAAVLGVDDAGLLVLQPLAPEQDLSDVAAVRLRLVGTTGAPQGRTSAPTRVHHIEGPPASWLLDLPTWTEIEQRGAWPGLDLALASEAGGVALSIVGQPGANLSAARLAVEGARASLDAAGRLVLEGTAPPLVLDRPVARALRDDREVELPASWALAAGPDGDPIVDVAVATDAGDVLTLRTRLLLPGGRLGGAFGDYGKAVAIGPDGDVYVAGTTFSWSPLLDAAWPAPGAPVTLRRRDADAFVARLDPRDGALRWWTVLGGTGGDYAQGLAVDAQGRAHVIGSTRSTESTFPVRGGPSLRFGGAEDAFVARLTPDGAGVEWCGFVGGAAGDYGQGIAVDGEGRVWISGDTKSDEGTLPVAIGPDLGFHGGADAFVGRLSADGRRIEFLGYIGGSGVDVSYDLALTTQGDAWLCGVADSRDDSFPVVVGPDLVGNGGWDGFVAHVRGDGAGLLSCGFVGGAETDNVRGLCVAPDGGVLLAGTTRSGEDSFPVRGGPGLQLARDPYDAYVAGARRTPGKEPYLRPLVYEREGCLPHVALVERPVLVLGPAAARTVAIHEALDRRSFAAAATVLLEDDRDPAALDAAALKGVAGVFLSGSAPDSPEARALLARAGGRLTARKTAVLWQPETPCDAGLRALDESRVAATCNALSIDLPTDAAPLLLLSETFALHPGWTARIDGQAAPLLHADGVITALRLPPGARRVELVFRPPGLLAGLAVSVATLGALVVAIVVGRRRA